MSIYLFIFIFCIWCRTGSRLILKSSTLFEDHTWLNCNSTFIVNQLLGSPSVPLVHYCSPCVSNTPSYYSSRIPACPLALLFSITLAIPSSLLFIGVLESAALFAYRDTKCWDLYWHSFVSLKIRSQSERHHCLFEVTNVWVWGTDSGRNPSCVLMAEEITFSEKLIAWIEERNSHWC